jgi:hypothetical protein
MWKDAMGPTVFGAQTNTSTVSAFAHCAPGGGLSVGYVNFSPNAPAVLDIHGPGALGAPRLLRLLTSADNTTIALNGVPLVYAPGSGALPPLTPKVDAGSGPLVLPPHSVGFVTWPKAVYYNCK